MDTELLRKIQPRELEDGAWMDKDKVSSFHSTAIVILTTSNFGLHAECGLLIGQMLARYIKILNDIFSAA